MRKAVLINAANLHVGGGVQVAVSFIYEIARLEGSDLSYVDVVVSTSVNSGLSRLKVNTALFRSYRVFDLVGWRAFFSPISREVKNYDVVFTVFGPSYMLWRGRREIVGFAQPWIIEPGNTVIERMSFFTKTKVKLKHLMQMFFYRRANMIVVELEHVRKKLIAVRGVDSSVVRVVHNTVSSVFLDDSAVDAITVQKQAGIDIHLGIVSRDYIHKNLSIFPYVASTLLEKHGLRIHFYVTFNDDEWAAQTPEFKACTTNVGVLQPSECPSFYQQVDAVIFPSLLECFSATPLEAMVMEKPLFASDRDFVRDVCHAYAFYFDPLDVDDIANVIADYYKSGISRAEFLAGAKDHARSFSSAVGRAQNYLKIIEEFVR